MIFRLSLAILAILVLYVLLQYALECWQHWRRRRHLRRMARPHPQQREIDAACVRMLRGDD